MTSEKRVFDFPYQPYSIQEDMMNNLYDSMENGYVSIIESPTGTGKSLSIICALAKWMEDFKMNSLKNLEKEIQKLKLQTDESNGGDDWLSNQLEQISNKNMVHDLTIRLDKLVKHISYSKELRKKKKMSKIYDKKLLSTYQNKRKSNEDDLEIDENLDDSITHFDDEIDFEENQQQQMDYFCPKIYYCSRTHSQLSQFINEFKKTKCYRDNNISVMMVPLSSRMNYCVNSQVNRLNNLNMINEKCNDLKQSKQKCCMYNAVRLEEFRDEILGNVCDLEEIITIGIQNKTCPYYSTRMAIPDAEIVVMPYNILLHQSTREHFNIKLKDSVVIIDEAHNLLETISNVHSLELKALHLSNLLTCLSLYMTKYYSRFNAKNLKFLKQIVFVGKKLLNFLQTSNENVCLDPLDLTIKMNIENINIHELLQFIDRSRIASKLQMFSNQKETALPTNAKLMKSSGTLEFLKKINQKTNAKADFDEKTSGKNCATNLNEQNELHINANTVYLIKDFLSSLNNYNVKAKVLVELDKNDRNNSQFKYVLLSPSSHFREILQECRSVILCGGTMKPFEDYVSQLFRPLNVAKERMLCFSCGHIISDDKLIAIGCSKGPKQIPLNFSYSQRNSPKTITETGDLLASLVPMIPKGIVIFFPSYEYQEFILKQWEKNGVFRILEKHDKRIFKEPKKSSLVQPTLSAYAKHINSAKDKSAILFSVIGGKMSEGINFSDDLGRAIFVVGLPYANKNSAELIEKINYLNSIDKDAGNEYYENLCMRAVNQSIGRAIRHKNDYAAIILLDERYGRSKINAKLPNWIKTRFKNVDQFSQVKSQVKQFFHSKNSIPTT